LARPGSPISAAISAISTVPIMHRNLVHWARIASPDASVKTEVLARDF
jgi:hypothetical protein